MAQITDQDVRELLGAIDGLQTQINQMRNIFNDEDGAIEGAMESADAVVDRVSRKLNQAKRMYRLLERALPIIKGDIEAIGGCDHDAGICICDEIRTAEEIDALLKELQ